MKTADRETQKDEIKREIYSYLSDLEERAMQLRIARDPYGVYNSIQPLRSLIGQIDSAARRYREIS